MLVIVDVIQVSSKKVLTTQGVVNLKLFYEFWIQIIVDYFSLANHIPDLILCFTFVEIDHSIRKRDFIHVRQVFATELKHYFLLLG